MLYGYMGPRKKRTWNGERNESDLWDFAADRDVVARLEDGKTIIEAGAGIETSRIVLTGKVSGTVSRFDGSTGDLWRFGRPKGDYVHPTQKPVALVERALTNSSKEGDLVFEPFCGSGTTIIAAEKLKRRCFAIELDPVYCDVAVERWQQWTGEKAKKVK
jgi:DNA modification methylase